MHYIKNTFIILITVLMFSTLFAATAHASSAKTVTEVELVDLGTVFPDADTGISLLGENDNTLELNKGNYANWIDRINIPDYAKDFYNTLAEYCDNDGKDDFLIDDKAFSKETATVIDFGPSYGSDTFHAIEYIKIKNPTDSELDYIYKTMRAAYDAFDMDHPEVFWLSGSSSAYRISYGSEETIYFLIKMHGGSYTKEFDVRAEEYRSNGTVKSNISIRDTAIKNILNSTEVKNAVTDHEKVIALNDWLTKNNEYNYDVYLNPTTGRTIAHRCISALKGSSGENAPVCEGYSKAFKVLCDKLHIPCVITIGKAYGTPDSTPEAHSWNCVKVDGVWFPTDITWNDPLIPDGSGVLSGFEHDGYLLVGEDSEISGMKFKDSHVATNILSTNGFAFKNGPVLSKESYAEVMAPPPALSDGIIRLSGKTRYETSFAIAEKFKEQTGMEQFQSVIIASGKNFADALAGSYLASKANAPILMTNGKNTDMLCEFIQKNLVADGTIYLLGGSAAVPDEVEYAAAELGNVIRLAGASRYDTNLEILKEAGVGSEEILVCTGKNFADSLSGSAAKKPILLVNNKELTDAQKAFLEEHIGNKFYIIGGEGAVNKEIETEISGYGGTERISGATRYETSVLFARKFFDSPKQAVLAYAKNFPDGLCGGALAMAMDAPLILTATEKEDAAETYMTEFKINYGVVLGGEGLINNKSANMIFGLN